MQVMQAGQHQVLLLELDADLLRQGAEESGFQCTVVEADRSVTLQLDAAERPGPLLLFDASDAGNTGWFSRCQFYVEGANGAVLQTPFVVANRRDKKGRLDVRAVDLQIRKEVPAHFKLPGRQAMSEKSLYSVLFSFLQALQSNGVGLCGSGVVKPLAGKQT